MAQKINELTLGQRYNIGWRNSSDPVTDYYPSVTGNMKYIIENVKEGGTDIIKVTPRSNKVPTEKRVKQICKERGYSYVDKSYMHTFESGTQRLFIEFELTKI